MNRTKLRVKLAQALGRREDHLAMMLANRIAPVKLEWHVGRGPNHVERFTTYALAQLRVDVLKASHGENLTYTL